MNENSCNLHLGNLRQIHHFISLSFLVLCALFCSFSSVLFLLKFLMNCFKPFSLYSSLYTLESLHTLLIQIVPAQRPVLVKHHYLLKHCCSRAILAIQHLTLPENSLEKLHLMPCAEHSESECSFQQDPQMIYMHIQV